MGSGLAPGPKASREVAGRRHARLLVIDDEPDVRDVFRAALTQAGHGVLTAPDGATGLEIAAHARPDIVVVDMFMPGIDGLATIRALHRRPARPRIIATSAGWAAVGRRLQGSPHDFAVLEDARRIGADAMLPKPPNFDELLATVERLLGMREA